MEPSGSGSGSGAAEPVEDDRIQEPASNGRSNASSNGAAAPPPPRATPLDLERPRREQAGGGAEGSSSAAAGVDRKGKGIAATPSPPSSAGSSSSSSSSAPSLDHAAAPFIAGAFVARGRGLRARLTWSDPLAAAAREEPDAASDQPPAVEQAAVDVANALWKRQVTTLGMLRRARGVSLYSLGMLKSFREEAALEQKEQIRRQRREICSEHVKHQINRSVPMMDLYTSGFKHFQRTWKSTHPITEVIRHHKLASDEANHLDAYSECRSVIEDGECFYRSFIFSYLEQVIDRQDTDEERRLLRVVDIEHLHHGALRWNSEFSRSSRAFKNLIEKVMRWKSHGRWNGMESTSSYRKEELLEFFSEYDTTQDTFSFLRSVVAIQLCWHSEVYEPLIPGLRGNYDLEDWCFQRVTPPRRFTDHVMMLALARALEVPLRVERVRGGYDPDIYTRPGVPRPRVTLLYSANHYEIIYPRAPSAESLSHQASQIENAADQVSSQQTSQREHPGDESSSE